MANIASWADLHGMRNSLADDYVLTADLTPASTGYDTYASASANSGAGWLPVGTAAAPFTGTFDGNGFKIVGLNINRPGTTYVGLFGYVNDATTTLIDIFLQDCVISGKQYVGGIAGYVYAGDVVSGAVVTGSITGASSYVGGITGRSAADLESCIFAGTVTASGGYVGGIAGVCSAALMTLCRVTNSGITGKVHVGGLIGYHTGTGTVSYCRATGTVKATSPERDVYVGGLIGQVVNGATIGNCYAQAAVLSTQRYCGGLIGYLANASALVSKCYSTGAVQSTVASYSGGLIGYKNASATVSDSFWDTETSGKAASAGGTGKTTAQMMTLSTFTGASWDIVASSAYVDEDWFIDATVFYPYLSFEFVALPATTRLKRWDGSEFKQCKLWCYIPPWTEVSLFYLRGIEDWVDVVSAVTPAKLTIAGLTGGYTDGNGEYDGNASVGLNQVGGTYTRSTGVQGEYGEITYNITCDSWDQWDNIGTWVNYRSDGGATWDAVASGTFKGSPIGAWDSGVSATGASYTISVTDNSGLPQSYENGAQPGGSITVYAGDTFYCSAGAICDWSEDPFYGNLDHVEVDGVTDPAWGGSFAAVAANHTFHAVYVIGT